MHIAVISDLHDNVKAWERINLFLRAQLIQTLVNCGDTAAPAMLKTISQDFDGQIHTVFGNVADRALETEVAAGLANVTHYGDRGECTIGSRRLAITHKPQDAQRDIDRGTFDLVCHGHTHFKRWEKIGSTLVLNPGTAGGMFQYPTFAVIELTALTCNFQDVTL